ncbi:hypothetical protein D3C76_1474470 [compost metagenome]
MKPTQCDRRIDPDESLQSFVCLRQVFRCSIEHPNGFLHLQVEPLPILSEFHGPRAAVEQLATKVFF